MPSAEPLVSVIMPCYNSASYIGRAIDSVIRQTYRNWELLIGDDASTDDTGSIIKRYKDHRIKQFHFQHRSGAVTVRNSLIRRSKGDFIALQDADDFSQDARLAMQINELQTHSTVGMVGCQVAYVKKNGKILRISEKPLNYRDVNLKIMHENAFCGPTMMMRREVLEAVGGAYRECFNGLSYEDYDLSLLIAQKYECYNLPDVLYFYRQHGQSTSKTVDISKFVSKDLVIHLAKQRKERGFDDLQAGCSEKVKAVHAELMQPYQDNPSLIHRIYASDFVYNGMFKEALLASVAAIRAQPLKLVNHRTLLYCARKFFKM